MASLPPDSVESLLGEIADEFTGRCQAGESPDVESFARRFPQLADVLRQLLPALQLLHQQTGMGFTLEPATSERSPKSLLRTSTSVGTEDRTPTKLDGGFLGPSFEVLEELGRGGMGVVYRARHHALGRVVAVKRILAGSATSPDQLERFRAEARAVARLFHPHIVQIYEIGEFEGLPYFTLEFVPGGNLAERVQGEPQDPKWAAGLVGTLAKAVQVAHAEGLLHRDLKPGNILLTADGSPKITDFGLVKDLDTEQARTATGAIVGTPAYMAPEQASGEGHTLTASADVYALGAILYELLVGRPPFKGTTVLDTLDQVRNKEPVPPRELEPRCPRDLDTICLKCLAKDPSKRYTTAQALAEDLERFQNGYPILARRASRWERTWRFCRRNPEVAALFFVIVVAGLFSAWFAWRSYAYYREAENNRIKAVDSFKQAEKNRLLAVQERDAADASRQQLDQAFFRLLYQVGRDKLENVPQVAEVRLELFQDGLKFYSEYLKRWTNLPNPPQKLLDRGVAKILQLHLDIIRMQSQLGNNEAALETAQAAQSHWDQATALQRGDFATRKNYLDLRSQLAAFQAATGHLQTAEDTLRSTLKEAEGWADLEQHTELLFSVGHLHSTLGEVVQRYGQAEEQRLQQHKALERYQQVHRRVPERPQYQRSLANAMVTRARSLDHKDPEEGAVAKQLLTEARELWQKLAEQSPNDQNVQCQLARTDTAIGLHHFSRAEFAEAYGAFEQSIARLESVVQIEPKIRFFQEELIWAATFSARTLIKLNRFDTAVDLAWVNVGRADQLRQAHPKIAHIQYVAGAAYNTYAAATFKQGETSSSRTAMAQSRALLAPVANMHPLVREELARNHLLESKLCREAKDHKQAVQALRQAVQLRGMIVLQQGGKQHRVRTELRETLDQLVEMYAESHDAGGLYQTAALWSKTLGSFDPKEQVTAAGLLGRAIRWQVVDATQPIWLRALVLGRYQGQMLRLLAGAHQQGFQDPDGTLTRDPDFRPMWHIPAFQALVTKPADNLSR